MIKPKSLKGKQGLHESLTKSISARLSPISLPQKFSLAYFDIENLNKKRPNPKLVTISKRTSNTTSSSPKHGCPAKSFGSLKKPKKSMKAIQFLTEKTTSIKEKSSKLAYISTLKKKLKEVTEENKRVRQEIGLGYINIDNKLWKIVEQFKKKFNCKLKENV